MGRDIECKMNHLTVLLISPAIIPLDVAVIDVPDRRVFILSNETEMIPLKHNGLIVLDPDRRTHTIIVYEPEIYLRFVQCIEVSSCSAFLKPETMKRISDDFCWAFLGDHFSIPENMPQKARIWMQFMQILSGTKVPPLSDGYISIYDQLENSDSHQIISSNSFELTFTGNY
ncbi:unnamed protein product [Acanthocheilonema viteae]|uniref:Uncharacterized protein n=1 Tax=Acanthocheilonema viteae TaxID=6277 RepID=A0A498SMC8_ACAVI|nr:unnamed protein product [Acanthocheilonema viteae]